MNASPTTSPGRITEVELIRIELPLVTPFRTSFGTERDRDILLVRIVLDVVDVGPIEGWGECVAMQAPLYSAEFVNGAEMVIVEHLLPRLTDVDLRAAEVAGRLHPVRGHPMAKAALEMAVLDAELRAAGRSFAQHLGVTRQQIPSGVSVGIFDDLDALLAQVEGYVSDGYRRIKLKIEPGWDLEPVGAVRDLIGPDLPLQVDANTAYTRDDIPHLCQLDAFDLLLIEQPLPEEDLIGHARLAAAAATPVCLDESIVSLATPLDAIELGAAEIVNIKPGRVGGYLEARRIHDACRAVGVPVWCGGMVETGIGRAANAGLAGLDGFTLPGDISASGRFYRRDIVTDPIEVVDGYVSVPTTPGLGSEVDRDILAEVTRSGRIVYRAATLDSRP